MNLRGLSPEIDERVDRLLAEMTLDEKLAQLGCAWINAFMDGDGLNIEQAAKVAPHGIGEVTRISGATALKPDASARAVNELQRYFIEETRLGIPVLVHEEGTGGFLARGATVFPQALGLASTFDPQLVEEVAAVIREQMMAVGARHCLAPVLDVARDPRWGRVEETFGEDPFLVGTIGVAYVRGLQSRHDVADGVLATGKHFLGYAIPEGGRNHAPVHLGPRELRDVYAEPFAAAFHQAGLATVMNSYSSVDGLPCAGSRSILTDLLRDELGFEGAVVADYSAISLLITHHFVARDDREAATLAINAGLDLELPETRCFGEPLERAIEDGLVAAATVDQAVRRVLGLKFALGLFERPFVDTDQVTAVFDTPAQRGLAQRAATAAITLVQNDGLLPLSLPVKVAVVGPGADDKRLLQGDYHYPAHLEVLDEIPGNPDLETSWTLGHDESGRRQPHYTTHVTPLEGLTELLDDQSVVRYAYGCDVDGDDVSGIAEAVDLASNSDVAVVILAGRSGVSSSATVGEARDATDLRLTGRQEELLRAVAATGTPVVAIVLSGRVHEIQNIDAHSNALIIAAPLGEEGGAALADVLFGIENPSGRLPVSLPRSVGQVPTYQGHRSGGSTSMFYGDYTDSPTTPLYPFGHGLSYTTFGYCELVVESGSTVDAVTAIVDVENEGERAGHEVVQLYVRDVAASVARPELQLVGFARIFLEPGAAATVQFVVHPSRLAFHDEQLRRVTEPGEYRFSVGASSADLRSEATVALTGDVVEYPLARLEETAVSVTVAEPKRE